MDEPDSTSDPGDAAEAPRVARREVWIEVISVVVLAVTALATAWSSYQASLWDGIQSSDYSQSSAARTHAAQLRGAANQYRLADLSLLERYVDATLGGDTTTADFYAQRFSPALRPAYDAWIALDPFDDPSAPPSPLTMPEYQVPQDAEAQQLEERADQLFDDGEKANAISDAYTLTTLLFAAVLFFTAISERFEYLPARRALLGLAGVGLVAGIATAAVQPVTGG